LIVSIVYIFISLHIKIKNPPNCFDKLVFGENQKILWQLYNNYFQLTQSFAFTEYDFYKEYEKSFKKSELGFFHSVILLHKMVRQVRFGESVSKKEPWTQSLLQNREQSALVFLRLDTRLSAPKLMEQFNTNIHYQISAVSESARRIRCLITN
jgi:hypothetical protein